MVVGLSSDPEHWNAAISSSSGVQSVTQSVYDSLLIDTSDGGVVPNLATSWDVSDDATEYTFHLVENAAWHDGQPFTSADVKCTAEENWKPFHSRNSVALANLVEVQTPDDYTAVFVFSEPNAALLGSLGKYDGNIVADHVFCDGQPVDSHPNNTEIPIGTGPFMVENYVPGDRVEMVKNPNYWREGQPYLDELIYRIIPDPASRALAIEAGEIDFLVTFSVPNFSEVIRLGEIDGITIGDYGINTRLASGMHIAFNLSREIPGDLAVRQAIAHSIDKAFLVENVMQGFGTAMEGPFTGSSWDTDDVVHTYEFDVDAANQLLDDAGYARGADGNRFTLNFVYDAGRSQTSLVAEVFIAQMAELGIGLEVDALDRETSIDQIFIQHDYDVAIPGEFLGLGPDPSVGIRTYFHGDNIGEAPFNNGSGYNNEVVNQALDAAAGEIDPDARLELFKTAAEQITEDLPMISLIAPQRKTLFRDEFTNFTWADVTEVDLASVHLAPTEASPTAATESGDPAPASPGASAEPSDEETPSEDSPLGLVAIVAVAAVVIAGIGFVLMRRRGENDA